MSTMPVATEWPTDAETYHRAVEYISHSGKEAFRKSRGQYARRYVHLTEPPPKATPALQLGSWLHTAALEPQTYTAGVLPTLKAADMKTIHEWREALYDHDVIRQILEADGLVEHSIRWTDELTGLELKARRDKVLPAWQGGETIIADLKTTDDANPDSFIWSVRRYGYHRQAAWYLEGHEKLAGERPRFLFMVISKSNLACSVCELPPGWITLGHVQNQRTLLQMKDCYESGDWREPWEKQIVMLEEPNERDMEG